MSRKFPVYTHKNKKLKLIDEHDLCKYIKKYEDGVLIWPSGTNAKDIDVDRYVHGRPHTTVYGFNNKVIGPVNDDNMSKLCKHVICA